MHVQLRIPISSLLTPKCIATAAHSYFLFSCSNSRGVLVVSYNAVSSLFSRTFYSTVLTRQVYIPYAHNLWVLSPLTRKFDKQ